MGNNNAGSIVYRHKIAQDKIDEAIDSDKEPLGEEIPKPIILPDGTREWVFN